MKLEEVIDSPKDLQEALRETVKWLDLGDRAFERLAEEAGDPIELGSEVQQDLLAVADFLDATIEGRKLGRYIWRNRYELDKTNDYDNAS